MTAVAVLVFLLILVLALGAFILLAPRSERTELKKRLSLLELRTIENDDLPDVLKSEILSDVPLLNRALSGLGFALRIDKRLKQAGLEMKVGTFALLSGLLFAVGLLAGALLHWPYVLLPVAGATLSLLPNAVVNFKVRRRQKKFMIHFPDALEMFARSLRAGHSFTGAIQLVGQEMPDPVGPEFRTVFDEQNLGIPLRQALLGMTDRVDSLEVKFFVTAILIQRETGGNLAEIIDKISHVIRERFRIQGQLKIYTAQARMTGIVLALLPLGVALAIGVLNPEFLKPLWFDAIGKFLIALAILMQAAGALVIRRIIRIKI